jgi:hypothetical protein
MMTRPSEKIPDIKVTVKSIKGKCSLGHQVGEELMFGGTHFWEKDKDAISVCCPDAENLVVFEIRRI